MKKFGPGTVDVETGRVAREAQSFPMKAVVLPKILTHNSEDNTGPFTTGLKESERLILIDGSDVPEGTNLKSQDEITFLGRDWAVSKVREHEGNFLEVLVKEIG